MKITYYITGDTHGDFSRFRKLPRDELISVIILGDAGLNFYLNEKDRKLKESISKEYSNINFYCVRGNHEERPENVPTMVESFDYEVGGIVYIEKEFLNIRYLKDGEIYNISDYDALVIGGAYSVDKYYRLANASQKPGAWTGWFKDEQLTKKEMEAISYAYEGKHFDCVLSHTCPISWEPRELFLSYINQDAVDKTMEQWLEEFKDTITFDKWYFGHYHANKYINNQATMLFDAIEPFGQVYFKEEVSNDKA